MHRLDRRIRILREKRAGAFDRDQYALERAARSRCARKVRAQLRRMRPVVLVTPRWSRSQRFLDDIGVDLGVGRPGIQARTLSLAPVTGRTLVEAGTWLVRALVEFTGVYPGGRAGRQAADRNGLRHVLRDVLRKTRTGPRRVLLMHGVENLPVALREDLVQVFREHMEELGDERRLNLLFACSVDAPGFEFPGAARVHLADFSEVEAVESLVEYLGPTDRRRLEAVVQLVGGVPALLDALGAEGERSGALATQRSEIWRALGPLADEIRGAVSIVSTHDQLADRLEQVARVGPVPREEHLDLALLRAGLIHEAGTRPGMMSVRAPVFADLALAS